MALYQRDTEGFTVRVLKILQELNRIKYVHIDRIKVRNPLTRTQEVVEDIYFVSIGPFSDKIWFICGAMEEGDSTWKVIHPDFTHINMCDSMNTQQFDKYRLLFRPFCNPVNMYKLWERPDDMKFIIKGNLLEGNPNDRWRTASSVDMDKVVPRIVTRDFKELNSKATLREIITRISYPEKEDIQDRIKYSSICRSLLGNHDLYYVPVVDGYHSMTFGYKLLTKEEMDSPRYWISNYYRTYNYKNIDEVPEIPIEEIDVGVFGCGSAGSAIIDQLRRLTYFKSITLVDPDMIEEKNLRNQIYTRRNLNSNKVVSCKGLIREVREVNNIEEENITVFMSKFQDVNELNYQKFKYLISGFDSFEARLELLKYIKSGEIKTKYLIDTRYEDLTSSLFFIDTENSEQLEYYERILVEDAREYELLQEDKQVEWTPELVDKLFLQYHVREGNCARTRNIFGLATVCTAEDCGASCCDEHCRRCWLQELKEKNAPTSKVEDSSCLAQNFIHIYSMTASWVTSIIRAIETDDIKTLTHVELGIDPAPQAMVLKK